MENCRVGTWAISELQEPLNNILLLRRRSIKTAISMAGTPRPERNQQQQQRPRLVDRRVTLEHGRNLSLDVELKWKLKLSSRPSTTRIMGPLNLNMDRKSKELEREL